MKKAIQIGLAIGILFLAYIVFEQIMAPLRFKETKMHRELSVIEHLKNIRVAEKAFKQKYAHYTGDFDSLINFALNDSLLVRKTTGSEDDSLAVAKGLVKTEEYYIMAVDTIFSPNKLNIEQIKALNLIPFGNGKKFILNAAMFKTESEVVVPVFECKAPYKDFLGDLEEQELINLIDERKAMDKYPGLKVGAINQATNDVGNWE